MASDHPIAPLDVDELVTLVRQRHNIRLDRTDPVLVTVTLLEGVLLHYGSAMQAHCEREADRITEVAGEQVLNAKAVAEQIVTSGAAYLKQHATDSAADYDLAAQKAIAPLLIAVQKAGEETAKQAARSQLISVICTGTAIVAAAVTVAVALFGI